MWKNLFDLKTTLYIIILFVVPFRIFGQSLDTTFSGQIILVYSDYTWELASNEQNLDNPFEKPSKEKTEKETKEKQNELLAFLKKEEIFKFLIYKKSKEQQSQTDNNTYEDYIKISNDIVLISALTTDNDDEKAQINNYYEKYFGVVEKRVTPTYEIPTVTGTSIENKVKCTTTEQMDSKGNMVKTTPLTSLLTYTPIKLQNYYKQKNYLTINTSLSKSDNKYFIHFEFIFNSKDIEKSYGNIPSDGFLRLSFINNKKAFFKINKSVNAKIENYTGRTIYSLTCEVQEKDDLRLLKRQYVSEIGLMWSSGFEDYPIFNIDHFKQKMDCLDE